MKRSFIALCLFLICVDIASASESSRSTQGIVIDLPVEKSKPVLVRISQVTADYILEFKSDRDPVYDLIVDTDAFIRLDEIVLITSDMCFDCKVSVRPKSAIDVGSTIPKSIEPIDISEFPRAVAGLTVYNQVGQDAYISQLETEKRDESLHAAITKIDSLPSSELGFEWFLQHALSIKANMQNKLGDAKGAKHTLEQVKEINSETIYAVQANYELSVFVSAGKEKEELLVKGIQIGQALSEKAIVAQGKNYLAISQIREQQFEYAYENLEAAKSTYQALGSLRNYFDVVGNLSWWANRSGNTSLALRNATEQKLLAEKYNDERSVLWSLYDMAIAYYTVGDFYKSLVLLESAESRIEQSDERLSDSYRSLLAFVLEEKAIQSLGIGDLVGANKFSSQAMSIVTDLQWLDRIEKLAVLSAEISIVEGNYEEAVRTLTKSLIGRAENESLADTTKLYLLLAKAYIKQENLSPAKSYLNQVKILLDENTNNELQAQLSLLNLEVTIKERKFDQALTSIATSKALFESIKNSNLNLEYQVLVARALERSDKVDQALEQLSQIRLLIEGQLKSAVNPSIRRAILAKQRNVYELSIDLTLRKSPEDGLGSLSLLEEFRARTLQENLDNALVGLDEDLNSLIHEQNHLFSQLISLATEWYSATQHDSKSLLYEISKLSTRLENLESKIRLAKADKGTHKAVFQKDSTSSKAIEVLQDELVFSYFLGEQSAWLWVVSKDGVEALSIDRANEVKSLAAKYSSMIATPPALRAGVSPFEQAQLRNQLSNLVLGKAAEYLTSGRHSKITIIADGGLTSVPFAALSYNGKAERLVEQFQINYSPSLRVLSKLRKEINPEPISRARALILASSKGGDFNGAKLPIIPYTLVEAQSIEALLGDKASLLVPPQLSKKSALSRVSENYRVLHVAAHGIYSSSLPAFSGLVVGSVNEEGGLWLAPEISRSKHELDLVVLSSCQSSQGTYVDGEGLMSLGRSFIESGAKQVVGSLWQVEDESTSRLMTAFYFSLYKKEMPVMEALRAAQVAILNGSKNRQVDPYYWASFQLLGST